jgi:hypothetical protein
MIFVRTGIRRSIAENKGPSPGLAPDHEQALDLELAPMTQDLDPQII